MTDKKKTGRPRGKRYPEIIKISVNSEMKADIEQIAQSYGKSLSNFLRGLLKKLIAAQKATLDIDAGKRKGRD